MRRYLAAIAVAWSAMTSSGARASGMMGEIHQYCGEATAIVIGTPVSYDAREHSAEFEVEQQIVPVATQPSSQPVMLHLNGGSGSLSLTGQTFHMLSKKGRFFVFVFPGNRTGDGRLGSIIELGEKGELLRPGDLECLDPQPKTADELIGQIRRVLSPEYRRELLKALEDAGLPDAERAAAARHLADLHVREAWAAMEALVNTADRNHHSMAARESLRAMFGFDEAKTTPICLAIVRDNRSDSQVQAAAQLLARRPSDDPQALGILLAAAARWEREARVPDEYPVPQIVLAISALRKKTPEVEALVLRYVRSGRGNVLSVAMAVAGQLKMRKAVPLICDHLRSEETTKDMRDSASLALACFVLGEFEAYIDLRDITEDEARQSAAEAFPEWRQELAQAQTVECCRGDRVVFASRDDQQIYVLVGWQQEGQAARYRKAVLLYRADGPATRSSAAWPAPRELTQAP